MSAAEVDSMVVAASDNEAEPVTVLGVLEMKSAIQDLGYAMQRYQETLSWLCGRREGYEPNAHRTKRFQPTGHFEKPQVHEENGRDYLFAPCSFKLFRESFDKEHGLYMSRFFLLTRHAFPWIVSSHTKEPMIARVSKPVEEMTDEEIMAIIDSARTTEGKLTTQRTLQLYLDQPCLHNRVLFISYGPSMNWKRADFADDADA
mmetsp:Transcript_45300/g.106929  ORF Transcript_45300/g.106929 Transcript_45300/m.106929 type:complete len:203 (-) Transcript_45300:19-627(-)